MVELLVLMLVTFLLALKVGWFLLGVKLDTLSLWTLTLAKNYGDLN